jgi:hypothetical protein
LTALSTPPTSEAATGANERSVTRVVHPSNGNFDFVIMQSGARDDLSELGGLLSGSPVYTVYLHVGAAREWLLEYCLLAPGKQRTSPYQVDVNDTPAISPPYPLATAVPNSILQQEHARSVVMHGFLTAAGNLRDVKSADAGNLLARQLLPLLGEWRFRPALKDREAIEVEILLVIPPNS